MKLRNKKTGKIYDVYTQQHDTGFYIGYDCDCYHNNTYYKTLLDLTEEWEDVTEEPKKFWFIDDEGGVEVEREEYEENLNLMKSIGNYFETREEAEKAVDKLKAWKRLKDNAFKFKGWRTADLGADKYYFVITAESDGAAKDDLDLLFGGEE